MSKRRRFNGSGYMRTQSTLLIEKKFFDKAYGAGAVGQDLQGADQGRRLITTVSLAQGTGESQRIGRKIGIESFHIYGQFIQQPVVNEVLGTPSNNIVRCILVVDTQNNGATNIELANLLDNSAGPVDDIDSFRKLDTGSRFTVLKDEFITLPSQDIIQGVLADGTDYSCAERITHMEFHKRFKQPLMIEYNGTNGTANEITSNNLFFCMISGRGPSRLFFSGLSRIRYTD